MWLCKRARMETGINGAVMKRQDPRQPWMNYVDVANVTAMLEKIYQSRGEDSVVENLRSRRRRLCCEH